jgi:hypothetical protein
MARKYCAKPRLSGTLEYSYAITGVRGGFGGYGGMGQPSATNVPEFSAGGFGGYGGMGQPSAFNV